MTMNETTEPEATYVAPPPFPEAGYIVFGIPDVPFSSVRLPLVWDINELNVLVAQSMEAAKLVREAYQETFPQPEPQARPAHNGAMITGAQQAPQRAAPAAQSARQRAPGEVTGFCPQHDGVRVLPSIQKFWRIEMDDEGNEVLANYFCPGNDNGTGANHTVWRREIVRG